MASMAFGTLLKKTSRIQVTKKKAIETVLYIFERAVSMSVVRAISRVTTMISSSRHELAISVTACSERALTQVMPIYLPWSSMKKR